MSDGSPTKAIPLVLKQQYRIKVSGFVNLGKWVQGGEALANDACFEFSKEKNTSQIETFKNSQDISVCDGKYHPNHIYQSIPFIAKQDRIHFWIYDTEYDDNSGSLQVQIIQIPLDN